jgi:hypothetical protein
VGIKKNRQAFYIAAIDDNGVIDPFPDAIEFVATVGKLPEIRFTTSITRIGDGVQTTVTKPFNPTELDTVGMFRPFSISYSGTTTNGEIRAYRFFPLTADVSLEGENEWTEDLSDTLRLFPNEGPDALPSGRLRLAAQVRDDAGAESPVDAGQFRTGVCQLVVNFEPDTEIFKVFNTYFVGGNTIVDTVDFEDNEPDTLPYNSWVTLFYRGWDSPYDSSLCQDVANKCIKYQLQYTREGEIDGGPSHGGTTIRSTIRWLPEDGEDNNPFGTTDSTSMTVGSETYNIRARAIDEYEKPDGTPDDVTVTGNFTPTIDSYNLQNYDGTVAGDGDTLVWDWWNPANFKGGFTDTLDLTDPTNPVVVKEFYLVVNGAGHDHPKEPDGSGVKSWLYLFRRVSTGKLEKLSRSGFWTDGLTVNAYADTIRLVRRYPWTPLDPAAEIEAFASLPGYLNQEYDFTIRGRDFALADVYEQFIFLNTGAGAEKIRLNAYNTSVLSRWTGMMGQRVYLKMTK